MSDKRKEKRGIAKCKGEKASEREGGKLRASRKQDT